MKIKKEYRLRESGRSYVVVFVGRGSGQFNGMITLNSTGAFLWKELQKDCTEEELVAAMLQKYDVSEESAANGVRSFLEVLRKHDFLEK